MEKYYIHYDPDEMEDLVKISPFSLKKDLKQLEENEMDSMAEELANELHKGTNRPPAVAPGFITSDRRVAWVKVRIDDFGRKKGKSNGYRCISLVDLYNKHAFVLHVYRHGRGEDKNISKAAQNALKDMVKQYSDDLNKIISQGEDSR